MFQVQHISVLFGGVQGCCNFSQVSLDIFAGVLVEKWEGIAMSAAHSLVITKPLKISELPLNRPECLNYK